jgi:hypothetical protein
MTQDNFIGNFMGNFTRAPALSASPVARGSGPRRIFKDTNL